MLYFSEANAKLDTLGKVLVLQKGEKIYSLDLPAGWSCPGSHNCHSKVVVQPDGKRKIKDGRYTQFRCFSASQEALFPAVYKRRQQNWAALRACRGADSCKRLILACLPPKCKVLRYHVSGDFFKRTYFEGAYLAAKERPDVLFYAYTKSLHFLCNLPLLGSNLPNGVLLPNFLVTASRGGKFDYLIDPLGIRAATVVFSEDGAGELPIDHTDDHAATIGGSFALLLHGVQPKNSKASQARVALKGKGSYSRAKK